MLKHCPSSRGACLALAALLLLAACASLGELTAGRERAAELAGKQGWTRSDYGNRGLQLVSWSRGEGAADGTLSVYIEGDGFTSLSVYQLSPDPTPKQPTVLQLAVQDPSPRKLYIGRPCQYLAPDALVACSPLYWSDRRFAPEVIALVNRVIDAEKARAQATRVRLFGWSGGGTLAALLAAQRDDVTGLVTAAANLDQVAWVRLHDLTPLVGSLNPADQAARLQAIRQVHFVGLDDDNVPRSIAESYARRMTDRSRTQIVPLAKFEHDCCWVEQWRPLLSRYVYAAGSGF